MVCKRGVPEDELPRLKDGTPLEYRFPLSMSRFIPHGVDNHPLPFLACMRLHLFRTLLPFDMAILVIFGNVPRSVRNVAQTDFVTGRLTNDRDKAYAVMDLIPHYDIILGMPGVLSARVFEHAQRHRTLICESSPLVFHADVWRTTASRPSPGQLGTPTNVDVTHVGMDSPGEIVVCVGHKHLARRYLKPHDFLNNPDFLEYS